LGWVPRPACSVAPNSSDGHLDGNAGGDGAEALGSGSGGCRENATGVARNATGAERGVGINPGPEAGGTGTALGIGTPGNQGCGRMEARINLLEEASIRRRLDAGMWNGHYTPVETDAKTRQPARTRQMRAVITQRNRDFPLFPDPGRAAGRCLSEPLICDLARPVQSRKRSSGMMLGGDFWRIASLDLDRGRRRPQTEGGWRRNGAPVAWPGPWELAGRIGVKPLGSGVFSTRWACRCRRSSLFQHGVLTNNTRNRP
jgi:hypothetical protein